MRSREDISQTRVPAALAVAFVAALSASILTLPAVLNGAPFLYIDSATYLAQGRAAIVHFMPSFDFGAVPAPLESETAKIASSPESTQILVVGGRSIYYGIMTYVLYAISAGWALLALQGLAVAWPMVLLMRRLTPRSWGGLAPLLAAALAFLTPAGLFVGLIMPDIWAAAMILAVAALATGAASLGSWEKAGLTAICALAVLFHLSHVALLAAMLATGIVACLAFRRLRTHLTVGLGIRLVALVVVGLLGQALFSQVIARVYGAPPISRPHLTAHLIDLGPGTRYAQATCPEDQSDQPWAICPYKDRLPTGWVDFLFDANPATGIFEIAPDDVKRRIASEDFDFALNTIRHAPWHSLLGLFRDGIAQLWHLSVRDVALRQGGDADLAERFPPYLEEATHASFLYDRSAPLTILTRLAQIGTALSVGLLFVLWLDQAVRTNARPVPEPRLSPIAVLTIVCLAGIVLNALVCGILASPYGRFQARVTWLLPCLAVVTLASHLSPFRRSRASIPASSQEGNS